MICIAYYNNYYYFKFKLNTAWRSSQFLLGQKSGNKEGIQFEYYRDLCNLTPIR